MEFTESQNTNCLLMLCIKDLRGFSGSFTMNHQSISLGLETPGKIVMLMNTVKQQSHVTVVLDQNFQGRGLEPHSKYSLNDFRFTGKIHAYIQSFIIGFCSEHERQWDIQFCRNAVSRGEPNSRAVIAMVTNRINLQLVKCR